MNGNVRVGMIGAGFAANFFAQSFHLVENAELVGVTSLDRAMSEAFAAKHGIPRVFDDRAALLECTEIDAVYIATLPADHRESMMESLRSGKHVLCEKPFCLSSADAREVFAFAKKRNLLAMEAMRGNFLPMTLEMEKRLREGEIGQIQYAIAQMGFKMDPRSGQNRVYNRELGGGCLFELGCYCVNSVLGVLGSNPKSVKISNRMSDGYGVDLGSAIVMEYEGGATGVAISSITSDIPSLLTVCGTKGYIRVPKFHFAQTRELYKNELFFPNFPPNELETLSFPYESSNEQFEAQSFVDAIRAGKTEHELMPPERSVGILKIIEACLAER